MFRTRILRHLWRIWKCLRSRRWGNSSVWAWEFCRKMGRKYPKFSVSWRSHWAELSTYFMYPQSVRTLIYTTNAIENYNLRLREVTKIWFGSVWKSCGKLTQIWMKRQSPLILWPDRAADLTRMFHLPPPNIRCQESQKQTIWPRTRCGRLLGNAPTVNS